jgi:hypothetical protein
MTKSHMQKLYKNPECNYFFLTRILLNWFYGTGTRLMIREVKFSRLLWQYEKELKRSYFEWRSYKDLIKRTVKRCLVVMSHYYYKMQCCGSMTFWCGSGSGYILKIHWNRFSTSFFKDKKSKKSQNNRNQGFSYYFCLMIEGSGSGSRSISLTNGSGSRRPKNLWIRIRNTDKMGERDCLAPPREADMDRRPPLPRSRCPPVPDRWNWPEKKGVESHKLIYTDSGLIPSL